MKIVLAILLAGVLGATVSPSAKPSPKPTSGRLPGVELSERASQITGVAISPLLGVSAVGAWKYWRTPEPERASLPWFCHPVTWGIGLSLIALCLLKDILGTGAPPFLKKPFDVIELFENKLSGAVATAAFVPFIARGIETFESASPTAGVAGPMLAFLHFPSAWAYVPIAIIAFLVIWLASHVINVLIVLSPFGFVDSALKLFRGALLTTIVVSYAIHPYLALTLCAIIFLIACIVARWAFRFSFFGTVFALDLLPFRKNDEQVFSKGVRAFTAKSFGTVPARAYGRVAKNANGQLTFTYRPWLVGPERSVALPGTSFALSKALLCPIVLHARKEGERSRFLLFILPRYRKHAERLGTELGLTDVRDGATVKGFKAAKNWFAETFRGKSVEALPAPEVIAPG
jgi:hypothetical protein